MGIIGDSLERAEREADTRPIPRSAGARVRYLVRQHKGSTRAVAGLLGVSQRIVERYVKDQIRKPKPALAGLSVCQGSVTGDGFLPPDRDRRWAEVLGGGGLLVVAAVVWGDGT